MTFDVFGDFEERGYLRNLAGEKDLELVKRIEHAAFIDNVEQALANLSCQRSLTYDSVLETHKTLFSSVYPWAGQDRLEGPGREHHERRIRSDVRLPSGCPARD